MSRLFTFSIFMFLSSALFAQEFELTFSDKDTLYVRGQGIRSSMWLGALGKYIQADSTLQSEKPRSSNQIHVDYFPSDPVRSYDGRNVPVKALLGDLKTDLRFAWQVSVDGSHVSFYNVEEEPRDEVQLFKVDDLWVLRLNNAPIEAIVHVLDRDLATGTRLVLKPSGLPPFSNVLVGSSAADLVQQLRLLTGGQLEIFVPATVAKPKTIDDHWPVTFISRGLIQIDGEGGFEAPEAPEVGTLEKLSTSLKSIYPDATVTPAGNTLLIRGTEKDVYGIKTALAKWIDIPYSQVRLDAWVYQGSERKANGKALAQQISTVTQGIRMAKALEGALRADLEDYFKTMELDQDAIGVFQKEPERLEKFGLIDDHIKPADSSTDLNNVSALESGLTKARQRHRPFVDLLVYLALAKRTGFSDGLQTRVQRGKAQAFLSLFEKSDKDELSELAKKWRESLNTPVFPTLSTIIDHGCAKVDAQTVEDFLKAYEGCKWTDETSKPGTSPEYLSVLASNADALFKNATDAISADMRRMVIEPLLKWIQELAEKKAEGKPALIFSGQTSIVVTSGIGAATFAVAESHIPFTPPTALTDDQRKAIAEKTAALPFFSGATLAAILPTLAGLQPSATQFATIGAGTSLSVRPTVLPGSRSARLEIELRKSVDVTKPSGDWTGGPIDNIKTQSLKTDVQVDAFDLLELSTFQIENVAQGDRRWTIPLLDGLPLLGSMFRGPRGTIATTHQGIVVVHVTIMPKTLDITRRYSIK